jgi:protoheme ferro-lyase
MIVNVHGKSKNIETVQEIDYLVTEGFEHYGTNLYYYISYNVAKWR